MLLDMGVWFSSGAQEMQFWLGWVFEGLFQPRRFYF